MEDCLKYQQIVENRFFHLPVLVTEGPKSATAPWDPFMEKHISQWGYLLLHLASKP